MGNRKTARAARKSAPVVIVNDLAALEAERALSPDPAIEIDQSEPIVVEEVADKVVDAEAIENNPDVIDSTETLTSIPDGETHYATTPEGAAVEIDERALDHTEPSIAAEVAATEAALEPQPEPEAPAQEPVATVVDDGAMLASRFPTSDEAIAYAGNMRLRNVNYSKQEDGQWAIIVRKPAGKPATPPTTEGATPSKPAAAPRSRTPRAKASAPRPLTRNAVIWAGLTRPEGVTKKEIDALLLAFQPGNPQPCGIGSDAKLFASRFGYSWKKATDGDATRYWCFLPEVEVEAEPEIKSEVEGESEPKVEVESAQESESARDAAQADEAPAESESATAS